MSISCIWETTVWWKRKKKKKYRENSPSMSKRLVKKEGKERNYRFPIHPPWFPLFFSVNKREKEEGTLQLVHLSFPIFFFLFCSLGNQGVWLQSIVDVRWVVKPDTFYVLIGSFPSPSPPSLVSVVKKGIGQEWICFGNQNLGDYCGTMGLMLARLLYCFTHIIFQPFIFFISRKKAGGIMGKCCTLRSWRDPFPPPPPVSNMCLNRRH